MISYLVAFNSLPKNIKDKINAPAVMARVSELGGQYGVNLASTVMRVMAGEIKLENLGAFLINDLGLSAEAARALEQQLRRSVFSEVLDFLLGAGRGPKLVFSEADERDARQAKPLAAADFDAAVDASVGTILEQSRLNFSDPLGSGRFRQVIKTYLRGSRDRLATFESLIKPAELGGVALSRDTAERILIIAGNFLPRATAPAVAPAVKLPVPEDTALPRSAEYTLEASLLSQGKSVKPATPESIFAPSAPAAPVPLDVSHEIMPPPPALVRPERTIPEKPAIFQRKGAVRRSPAALSAAAAAATSVAAATSSVPSAAIASVVAGSAAAAVPLPPTPRKAPRTAIKEIIERPPLDKQRLRAMTAPAVDNTLKSPSGKVRMDDIRHTPRAESPIDELKEFTLTNFRRLDPDPLKATAKLRQTMEDLGREEYARKIEAIVAWQQSPLNRLYLLVCRRSLDENMAISAILEREQRKEPAFLRADELAAIISLNRSLKF